jgi:ATP-dependent DNA helicase RecG
VEIINPGGLVSGLKLADLGRVSMPRNPLLFALMHRLELVEDVGSGIRRIRDEMRNYGLEKPLIETGEAWFSIAFKRKLQDAALDGSTQDTTQKPTRKPTQTIVGETAQKILDAIRRKPSITRNELAEIVGITPDGIKYQLRSLNRKGALRRIGSDRGGHWVVVQGDSR